MKNPTLPRDILSFGDAFANERLLASIQSHKGRFVHADGRFNPENTLKSPLKPGGYTPTGTEWRDRVLAAGTSHDYGAPVF
ncbi:MAG TPA: hypothetical protein VL202_01920 [Pararhizobium sp.]|uniref:hypothetical protein n=1 Tax=Pararhizobium sp. TaxID=1977563 RepID=UPI002BE57A74|nr:hypothetical protein [Pararhizobium sp.]HTO29927.1 hypothetical protein [Pararhizobium sp.]